MSVYSEIDSGVAHIRFGNPKAGNALGASLLDGLSKSLKNARHSDTCRAIILSAEGDEFCRGLDIEEAFQKNGRMSMKYAKLFLDNLMLIKTSERPVIACVEGNVSGGGVGLVAACDIVLADENVTFRLPEVIVGMIPALIAPFLLHRMSPGSVRYMALSTKGFTAREAMTLGLVDEMADDGMEVALERQLQRLFHSSPRAIAETKKYLESLNQNNLRVQIDMAFSEITSWLKAPENVDDIVSFSSGRPASWFQKYRGKVNV